MRTYLIAYVSTALVFFGLDFLWLGLIARNLYRARLGELLSDQPNLAVAGIFYVVYVLGPVVFVVVPSLAGGSWLPVLLKGALIGLVAYGTYDMTNLATLRNWPVDLSLIDLAWGTALTAVSSLAGVLITRAVAGSL